MNKKEAIKYMINEGGKVNYIHPANPIKGINFTENGDFINDCGGYVNMNDRDANFSYTKVKQVPKALPHVGKLAISRDNPKLQGIVYSRKDGLLSISCDDGYYNKEHFESYFFIEGKDF